MILSINVSKEDKFLHETSFLSKIFYILCATCMARFKYYHAWILGEVICNASGLGFTGYTPDGRPDWELLSNIDIFGFEVTIDWQLFHIFEIRFFCLIDFQQKMFRQSILSFIWCFY